MNHNLHGDVPLEHREIAEKLLELEDYFTNKPNIISEIRAKGFVCIAHDWYAMGDDDKGSLLLLKANDVCPKYFDNEMHTHIAADPDFDKLVKSLVGYIFDVAKSVVESNKC